jgi:phosphate transport system substrate-binding protein
VLDVQPVALDAFVFLLNAGNPVDDLPLETIRKTYTGEITHWSELGAGVGQLFDAAEEIRTYQRNPNSGSQELMEKLVMRGTPMMPAPDLLLDSMSGPINALSTDSLGIGYSVYFYAVYILPSEDVKLIGVDGVVPTSDTIADRSYPLATEVYAVIPGGLSRDHTVVQLRDWLLTVEGQAVVTESGYVPIHQ